MNFIKHLIFPVLLMCHGNLSALENSQRWNVLNLAGYYSIITVLALVSLASCFRTCRELVKQSWLTWFRLLGSTHIAPTENKSGIRSPEGKHSKTLFIKENSAYNLLYLCKVSQQHSLHISDETRLISLFSHSVVANSDTTKMPLCLCTTVTLTASQS